MALPWNHGQFHEQYQTPYIDPNDHQYHSPFIPNLALENDPLAPNTPPHRHVHFEGELEPAVPLPVRPVSWHAGVQQGGPGGFFNPGAWPVAQDNVQFPVLGPVQGVNAGHGRRHSFSNVQQPPFMAPHPQWMMNPGSPVWWAQGLQPYIPLPAQPPGPQPPRPQQPLLHPLLKGRSNVKLYFDLSNPVFHPQKIDRDNRLSRLSTEELKKEIASWPTTNHLTITCDMVPQWPVKLKDRRQNGDNNHNAFLQIPGAQRAQPPPTHITLYDVLVALHAALQTPISHSDWSKIRSSSDEIDISRAYTKRCRMYGHSLRGYEDLARAGVRRVDFLRDKCMFGSLEVQSVRDGRWEAKLVVEKR